MMPSSKNNYPTLFITITIYSNQDIKTMLYNIGGKEIDRTSERSMMDWCYRTEVLVGMYKQKSILRSLYMSTYSRQYNEGTWWSRFAAIMPMLLKTSTSGIGRRCYISPKYTVCVPWQMHKCGLYLSQFPFTCPIWPRPYGIGLLLLQMLLYRANFVDASERIFTKL